MRKVLFINSSIYLPGEGAYKRTLYLFDMMKRRGYNVTLLTGDFNHYNKKKRNVESFYKNHPEYTDIIMLHKMKYKRNISFMRYLSDYKFAYDSFVWVKKNIKKYDVLYLNMPNMYAIKKISPICKKYRIPMVIDIRDLYPEAMKIFLKNELIYKILTFPMKKSANKAYACADEFVAVSKEYLERGLSVNTKVKRPTVVYIGASLERFDEGVKKYSTSIKKSSDEFWLAYVGTIGVSYDLLTVIKAVEKLKKEKKLNVRFKILGQGPQEEELKNYVKRNNIDNIDFMGFMSYEKMAAYLSKCDVMINCIKKNASQSIINKVADYFASGKPVLNSCKNEEMKWLISHYKTGYNYEAENEESFIEKVLCLYNNAAYRELSGSNSRKLAEEKFDRKNSYKEIIKIIDNVEFQEE